MGDPGMSQVSSDVPEGKGVSSSAALEVATMSAIAAAYGKFLAYECHDFWAKFSSSLLSRPDVCILT